MWGTRGRGQKVERWVDKRSLRTSPSPPVGHTTQHTHTQAENTNNVGKAAFLVADYFGRGLLGEGGGGDIEALQSD